MALLLSCQSGFLSTKGNWTVQLNALQSLRGDLLMLAVLRSSREGPYCLPASHPIKWYFGWSERPAKLQQLLRAEQREGSSHICCCVPWRCSVELPSQQELLQVVDLSRNCFMTRCQWSLFWACRHRSGAVEMTECFGVVRGVPALQQGPASVCGFLLRELIWPGCEPCHQ